MLETASTLSVAQASRAVTLPARAMRKPSRVVALEGIRQRNTLLDALFYDVGKINQDEAVALSPWLAAEGSLLIVPPTGTGALKLCDSIDDYLSAGGQSVRTLAVAGVGSSALGSAAFARNVADASGTPVAAVVSGYGLADVVTEALGGFFWFGALNSIRHIFEGLDRLSEEGSAWQGSSADMVRESRDTATVLALLREPRLDFNLLVGHSKGNLVLSEALYELKRIDGKRLATLAKDSRVVTISARIAMPPPLRDVVDVMGAWDWFGGLNSRLDIPPDVLVPTAWHHTNTELPAHLDVKQALSSIL